MTENNITDYKTVCLRENKENRQKEMFLLISGDMSGIQNFIYTIASAGALKSLRGRSFYLDMVLEYIVDEILAELSLNRCNLIYTGGGHFYILAANTQSVQDKLLKFKENCNEWFLQKTGTTLYLELGWQKCSAVNFMVTDEKNKDEQYAQIGNVFRNLSGKLSRQKLSRYTKEQLNNMFNPVSEVNKTQDGTRECGICHTSSAVLQNFHGKSDEDNDTKACALCNQLYDFGREIIAENKTVFAVINDDKGLPLPSWNNPCSLYAMDKNDLVKYSEAKIKRLYTKNILESGKLLSTNLWVGDYIITKTEDNNDLRQTVDFEYLAQKSQGIKRMGVLRADVDKLGQTFATAFRSDKDAHYLTLSRMASLSRQLSLFFKKYINCICKGNIAGENEQEQVIFSLWKQQQAPGARNLAIVYSGGDDVFVVGAWNEVLEFAVDLYKALQRFSNRKITISAGMAMLKHNYPISRMAEIAGELEALAKDSGRNRIAILDNTEQMWTNKNDKQKQVVHCYEWPVFIDNVIGEKMMFLTKYFKFNSETAQNKIVPLGQGHLPIGKGQLYRLIEFLREKLNGSEQQPDKPQRMNIAHFIYWLARLQPDKNNAEAGADYKEIREKLYNWLTDNQQWQDSQQLLTALVLLIYGLREQAD